jgi:hypothetical protein
MATTRPRTVRNAAAALLLLLPLALVAPGCSGPIGKHCTRKAARSDARSMAGGFWEGHHPFLPSYYYGYTFIESQGELMGTCFQGAEEIRLYLLEDCKIQGSRFQGRKTYSPVNDSERIEGAFDGDSCRLTNYVTDGYGVVELHRVHKLSRAPSVFIDPAEKKQ